MNHYKISKSTNYFLNNYSGDPRTGQAHFQMVECFLAVKKCCLKYHMDMQAQYRTNFEW